MRKRQKGNEGVAPKHLLALETSHQNIGFLQPIPQASVSRILGHPGTSRIFADLVSLRPYPRIGLQEPRPDLDDMLDKRTPAMVRIKAAAERRWSSS
jgi:hypothetical protein